MSARHRAIVVLDVHHGLSSDVFIVKILLVRFRSLTYLRRLCGRSTQGVG